MMQATALLFLFTSFVLAAVNEPCYGPNGVAGVCVSTASCTASGGTTISNACPKDPDDIKCCSKPSCTNGSSGNCRWTSDCEGTTVSNQCPGPSTFKCCSSNTSGFGGYGNPGFPAVGACKAVAVDGAKKVVAAWPGRVREIGCIRDGCGPTCEGNESDHCCGMAIDLMCSDAGGTPTSSGREIAEWAMNNRATLNLKYVIWGQRIWNPSEGDTVKAWTSWRGMDDRNSITDNHWDHVHVSFN